MDPIISFLCSPLGIIVAIIAAALAGRFLWHVVVFAVEFALVAAIIRLWSTRSAASMISRNSPARCSSTRRRTTCGEPDGLHLY